MDLQPGLPVGSTSAKNLQRAEVCSHVLPAVIGPYLLSAPSPLLWESVENVE